MVRVEEGAEEEGEEKVGEEEGEWKEVVDEEEWKEAELVDAVERGNTRENLEMEEPELRLKINAEVVERETGALLKTMQRKEKRALLTFLLKKPPLLKVKLLLLWKVKQRRKLELRTRSLSRKR